MGYVTCRHVLFRRVFAELLYLLLFYDFVVPHRNLDFLARLEFDAVVARVGGGPPCGASFGSGFLARDGQGSGFL